MNDDRVRELIQLQLKAELHALAELKRHKETYLEPTVKMLEDEHNNRQARNRAYKWAGASVLTSLGVLQAYGEKIKAFLFG